MKQSKPALIGIGALVLIFLLFLLFKPDEDASIPDQKIVTDEVDGKNSEQPSHVTESTSDTIHFYLENSGSMNGYLETGSDFKATLIELLYDLGKEKEVETYYINTQEYHSKKSIDDFLMDLDAQGIKIGETGSSELNFMFERAITKAIGSGVSFLVSDGVYSIEAVNDANEIKERLNMAAKGTRNSLLSVIKSNNLHVHVIKLSSDFKGRYYTADGSFFSIDNEPRPYYIWVFGEQRSVKTLLRSIKPEELPGYRASANFFTINKEEQIPYSMLTTGPEKVGDFSRSPGQGNYTKVVENTERSKANNKLRFAVAVDFKDLPLDDSYFSNLRNYEIKNAKGPYSIEEVISKEDFKPSTLTALKTLPKTFDPSHLLVLETQGIPFGDLEINLKNKVPDWIIESSTFDDNKYNQKTFGFEELMTAFTETYHDLNETPNYASLKLQINR